MESTDKNKATTRKIYELFGSGNTSELSSYISEKVVDHDLPPGMEARGLDIPKRLIEMYNSAFPDFNIKINEMVAEEDMVCTHITISGTHQGEFWGIAPTNNRIETDGFDRLRFENGKVAERWGLYDYLKMWVQMGVLPEMREIMDKAKRHEAII